jgi:hypothetical protein
MKRKSRYHHPLYFLFLLLAFLIGTGYAQQTAPTSDANKPTLKASEVEHSTWVEDWTNNLDTDAYIAALPPGVNTIHVFVGQLALVNGQPSINGYTLDTPDLLAPGTEIPDLNAPTDLAKKYKDQRTIRLAAPTGSGAFPDTAALIDFVTRCKAAGVVVKLSVGGQSGTGFGNSWSVLTEDNIDGFAQALVDICHTTTADGIDFDEELEDTTIAALAGKLAGAFKTKDEGLFASYCVYGGCDATSGPWHETNTVFLQNAVYSDNYCAINRVYVMTYYDGCTLEQNEGFMTSWITWLSVHHAFTASRISAGVDPNDPTTSPNDGSLTTWIDFAASQGLSTAIWDQLGVNDYVDHNWGTQITNIYNNSQNTRSPALPTEPPYVKPNPDPEPSTQPNSERTWGEWFWSWLPWL